MSAKSKQPASRRRVAWLVVNEHGHPLHASTTKRMANYHSMHVLGWRVVRVEYPWPPVSRAKRGEK